MADKRAENWADGRANQGANHRTKHWANHWAKRRAEPTAHTGWVRALRNALVLAVLLISPLANAEQTWKINIKNGDIQEFVRQVAQITGKTFIIDPRLKGDVTVLSNSSMDANAVYELFLSVLRVHNFTATESGDVVRIQQNALGKQTPGARGNLSEIAPEELVTRVISAQNVASEELLKILRPLIPQYGHIAAVQEPNIVIISDHADNILRLQRIIRQIDVADEEELVVRPLEHAWVGSVVAILEKVAPDQIGRAAKGPQRVRLIANENNNTLMVKGNARPTAEILKLVDQLDKPTTAKGSTQVFTLNHADAATVADILSGIITESAAAGQQEEGAQPTTIKADESLNAIVVKADPSKFGEIRELIAALDVRRSQVLIEAAIVEVSIEDTQDLGVELAAVDARGETLPLVTTSTNGTIANLIGQLVPDAEGNVDVLTGLGSLTTPTLAAAKIDADAISFGAVIQAIATNRDANLLSTPSIMTLDNQEAKIVVGNEVPFRTGSFTTNTDGANNPFTTIQREDVGLQLTVTPQVNESSTVRLEVAQEVSNIVPGTNIGSTGASDIVTSKRSIETVILADDKQTIVLGGLMQDDVTATIRKVPLLGDIPVLGNLFKTRNNTQTKRNLLVFLRPTVIRNLEDADAATQAKYQRIYEVEIQSIGRGYDSVDDLVEGRRSPPREG
ncbi:MAG: type II secretion system secretin GspD [Pseudomonadota bacterium]